jgi:hypothetical protein
MNKKFLIVSGLLILATIGLFWFNKHILALWNANSINVSADTPLSSEKVKVEFGEGITSINRTSDSELFTEENKNTILFDGKNENKMINIYGENDFIITYDNKYYFSFRQFKFNQHHNHDYYFHFHKNNDTIFIDLDIVGEDGMKFSEPMAEISKAAKNRFGKSI